MQVDLAAPQGFLPSAFDAARPFTLILQLEPGTWMLGRHVLIGVAGG